MESGRTAHEEIALERLLGTLPPRPDIGEITRRLVPPPRFGGVRFSNYHPAHPSQVEAEQRLRTVAARLARPERAGLGGFRWKRRKSGSLGIYIDGGFGVGKTHLLAALWHDLPSRAAYLTFDELMYFVGTVGVDGVAAAFADHRLVAIDEWELDDPGNLKMAIAVVRRLVGTRTFVAATSNILPLDLGVGRFSQKDFRAEIEELAESFEVITIGGSDYRHRHFDREPGAEYLLREDDLARWKRGAGGRITEASFSSLMRGLAGLHPIRYREVIHRVDAFAIRDLAPVGGLADALRWVHFVDSVYDAGVRLAATGGVAALGDIFDAAMLAGPYGKKLARCLSRLEELFGEAAAVVASPFADRDGGG